MLVRAASFAGEPGEPASFTVNQFVCSKEPLSDGLNWGSQSGIRQHLKNPIAATKARRKAAEDLPVGLVRLVRPGRTGPTSVRGRGRPRITALSCAAGVGDRAYGLAATTDSAVASNRD